MKVKTVKLAKNNAHKKNSSKNPNEKKEKKNPFLSPPLTSHNFICNRRDPHRRSLDGGFRIASEIWCVVRG